MPSYIDVDESTRNNQMMTSAATPLSKMVVPTDVIIDSSAVDDAVKTTIKPNSTGHVCLLNTNSSGSSILLCSSSSFCAHCLNNNEIYNDTNSASSSSIGSLTSPNNPNLTIVGSQTNELNATITNNTGLVVTSSPLSDDCGNSRSSSDDGAESSQSSFNSSSTQSNPARLAGSKRSRKHLNKKSRKLMMHKHHADKRRASLKRRDILNRVGSNHDEIDQSDKQLDQEQHIHQSNNLSSELRNHSRGSRVLSGNEVDSLENEEDDEDENDELKQDYNKQANTTQLLQRTPSNNNLRSDIFQQEQHSITKMIQDRIRRSSNPATTLICNRLETEAIVCSLVNEIVNDICQSLESPVGFLRGGGGETRTKSVGLIKSLLNDISILKSESSPARQTSGVTSQNVKDDQEEDEDEEESSFFMVEEEKRCHPIHHSIISHEYLDKQLVGGGQARADSCQNNNNYSDTLNSDDNNNNNTEDGHLSTSQYLMDNAEATPTTNMKLGQELNEKSLSKVMTKTNNNNNKNDDNDDKQASCFYAESNRNNEYKEQQPSSYNNTCSNNDAKSKFVDLLAQQEVLKLDDHNQNNNIKQNGPSSYNNNKINNSIIANYDKESDEDLANINNSNLISSTTTNSSSKTLNQIDSEKNESNNNANSKYIVSQQQQHEIITTPTITTPPRVTTTMTTNSCDQTLLVNPSNINKISRSETEQTAIGDNKTVQQPASIMLSTLDDDKTKESVRASHNESLISNDSLENSVTGGTRQRGRTSSSSNIAEEAVLDANGASIKKIVLKNNEVVLIEDCSNSEDEEYKAKSAALAAAEGGGEPVQELFPGVSPSKKTVSEKVSKLPQSDRMTKSSSKSSTSEDDPFVKAALERFDAFFKSKSTSDQPNQSTSSFTAPTTPKSPYLTRKAHAPVNLSTSEVSASQSTNQADMQGSNNNLTSFIKRRQARIEPSLLNKSKNGSTGGHDSRSLSESRSMSSNYGNQDLSLNHHSIPNEPGLSSLAKKYLGNLNSSVNPTAPETKSSHAEPTKIAPAPVTTTKEASQNIEVKKPVQSRSVSIGAPLISNNKLISAEQHHIEKPPVPKSTVSDSNRSGSSTQSNNSLNSSINSNGSSSTASSPRQVNLIKLEVINSSKDRNKTNDSKSKSNTVWNSLSKESASSRETNKPPLPPGSQSTAAAVNTGAAANIIPPGLAPNAWRSKLKSVSHSQSQSHNSSLSDHSESSDPPSKSSDHTRAPSKSRIIPIEIKNSSSKLNHSKSSTGSCYSSNSNTSSSVHRSLSSAASSSLASNKSEKNNTSSTNSSTSQSKANLNTTSSSNGAPSIQERIRSLSASFKQQQQQLHQLQHNDKELSAPPSPKKEPSFSLKNTTIDTFVTQESPRSMYSTSSLSRGDSLPLTRTSLPTAAVTSLKTSLAAKEEETEENIYDAAIKENPILDHRPDPIVEKACNNFMYKLIEYQRHNKVPASPYSTLTTPTLTSTPTTTLATSYTSPSIVETIPTPPVTSIYQSPYLSTSVYNPPTLSSSYSTSEYLNDGSNSARPYVSAIRKRRTLFDSSNTNISVSSNDTTSHGGLYTSNMTITPSAPTTSNHSYYNKPSSLSLFNTSRNNDYLNYTSGPQSSYDYQQYGEYEPYNVSINSGNVSSSDNPNQSINSPSADENTNSITNQAKKISSVNDKRPDTKTTKLKKSFSTTGKLENQHNLSSNSSSGGSPPATPTSSSGSHGAKIRSTVFDRLAALNSSTNPASSTVASSTSRRASRDETSGKQSQTSSYTSSITEANIKLQNEIAIVTSMMPSTGGVAKRKDSLPGFPSSANQRLNESNSSTSSSTNSNNITISRIRSLDSKSREKFKQQLSTAKVDSSLSQSNKMKASSPTNSISSNSSNEVVVPTCYLYPASQQPGQQTSDKSRHKKCQQPHSSGLPTSPTTMNNPSSSSNTANKTDVFERLSKRTISMKNLSRPASRSHNYQLPGNNSNNSGTASSNSDNEVPADLNGSCLSNEAVKPSTQKYVKAGSVSSNEDTESTDDHLYGINSATASQSSMRLKPCKMINNNSSSGTASSSNLASKTSVFERLYKSNIAAHLMSHQNETAQPSSTNTAANLSSSSSTSSNNLKKNMSTSSTSLVSSTSSSHNFNTQFSIPPHHMTSLEQQQASYKPVASSLKKSSPPPPTSATLNRQKAFSKPGVSVKQIAADLQSVINKSSNNNSEIDENEISQCNELANSSASSFLSHQIS